MNASEYIVMLLTDGALTATHHSEYIDCGLDLDETTAHCVVKVLTNDCATLIEVLQTLQPFGITLCAMHRLHGKYKGCLELDLQLMQRRMRKPKPLDSGVPQGENV